MGGYSYDDIIRKVLIDNGVTEHHIQDDVIKSIKYRIEYELKNNTDAISRTINSLKKEEISYKKHEEKYLTDELIQEHELKCIYCQLFLLKFKGVK